MGELFQFALQSCRPLSGAVSCLRCCWDNAANFAFNRAAPFRERLACPDCGAAPPDPCLQSCRPLSGAVSSCSKKPGTSPVPAFNRAAPFRERLVYDIAMRPAAISTAFNRAAPFRERLVSAAGAALA